MYKSAIDWGATGLDPSLVTISRVDELRRVATRLESEVEVLAVEALRRMQEREPEVGTAVAGQRGQVIADLEEALLALAEAMRRDIADPGRRTGGAARFVVAMAAAGISWRSFARAWSGYRAAVVDLVVDDLAGAEPAEPVAAEAQRAVMMFLLAYEDAAGAELAAAFQEANGRGRRRRRPELSATIDDLLAGRVVNGAALPFDLEVGHLAAIAWGAGSRGMVEDLVHFLGFGATIEQRRDTVWAWFHGVPAELGEALARVREYSPPGEAQLALGEPEDGAEGFATSYLQACGAERVGIISGALLTLFVDIGLEAFALDDERLARAFVARELGPLAEDDTRAATLRETLAAYFSSGNSASAAAATLELHERTVSYRIRAAEQRLGRYVVDCQDELALALRLCRLFATAPKKSPARQGS